MMTQSKCVQYQINLIKSIIGIRSASNFLQVRDDDIWLVSYPKSGNTWLRFLLGNLSSNASVDFLSIERIIPDIYANSMANLCKLQSPRILKSHEAFDRRYKKIIYIVRDPRDVVISYLKHQQKMRNIPTDYSMDVFGEEFIKGALPAGSWKEHVGSWLGAKDGESNFILIRYEDLLKDTENTLRNIVSKITGFPVKREFYQAVVLSSFERMKELEKLQSGKWLPTRNSDKNINFIRAGKSEQWKESLSPYLSEKIWKEWGNIMEQLGYQP